MRHLHRRPSASRIAGTAMIVLIVALAGAWGPGRALGDGDPASDVLVFKNVFLPLELSYGRQYEVLNALLTRSARDGFPIRVALIDAPDDLGTVTSLWLNPTGYSQYLGTELSLAFTGQVAVVMPNGIGVWRGRVAPTSAEERVADALPAPGSGPALITAAISAVERLAAAEGHPLPTAGIRVSAPASASGGSGSVVEWLALALGALLIAVAWTASLRARPLRPRRRAAA